MQGMATKTDLINETNARYWVGTGYKVGERLDPANDPVDQMHARRWLQTYRDLERQNAAGTLVLFHKDPSFARSLAEAARASQLARATGEGDPRYAEAVRAKQQALSDATLWQEMIASRGGTTAVSGRPWDPYVGQGLGPSPRIVPYEEVPYEEGWPVSPTSGPDGRPGEVLPPRPVARKMSYSDAYWYLVQCIKNLDAAGVPGDESVTLLIWLGINEAASGESWSRRKIEDTVAQAVAMSSVRDEPR